MFELGHAEQRLELAIDERKFRKELLQLWRRKRRIKEALQALPFLNGESKRDAARVAAKVKAFGLLRRFGDSSGVVVGPAPGSAVLETFEHHNELPYLRVRPKRILRILFFHIEEKQYLEGILRVILEWKESGNIFPLHFHFISASRRS